MNRRCTQATPVAVPRSRSRWTRRERRTWRRLRRNGFNGVWAVKFRNPREAVVAQKLINRWCAEARGIRSSIIQITEHTPFPAFRIPPEAVARYSIPPAVLEQTKGHTATEVAMMRQAEEYRRGQR